VVYGLQSVKDMDRIAVIVGAGELPFLIIDKIKQKGEEALLFALKDITKKEIKELGCKVHWLHFGELEKLIALLKEERVKKLIFSGKIDKKMLLQQSHFDSKVKQLLGRMEDKGDFYLLKTLSNIFQEEGIELLSPYIYLSPYLVGKGVLSKRKPSAREMVDIKFGWNIAKSIAHLDIGHTVVVKEGIVFAVESVEGTNSTIKRGGKLGGAGAIVVKVARDNQDSRFDHPPVIGLDTLKISSQVGISAIAFEADKTIILNKDSLIKGCNANNIALVGI
jgi:DUF1009 family protein